MQQIENPEVTGTLKTGAKIQEGIHGAPWAWFDEQTRMYMGFEIDIARAIAEQLHKNIEFLSFDSPRLMMGLINNKCDMCIGAIKTDNTMAGIAFSTPYYYLSQRIVVLETQNVYDLIDLKDTYVGVLSNSLAEYIITEENKNLPSPIKLKTYQDVVNLFSDLKFGEIEALFIDSPVALWYSRSYLNKDFKVTDVAYKSGSYSIAVNNDNEELLKDINRALQKIDLREILDKYGLWDEAQESY